MLALHMLSAIPRDDIYGMGKVKGRRALQGGEGGGTGGRATHCGLPHDTSIHCQTTQPRRRLELLLWDKELDMGMGFRVWVMGISCGIYGLEYGIWV